MTEQLTGSAPGLPPAAPARRSKLPWALVALLVILMVPVCTAGYSAGVEEGEREGFARASAKAEQRPGDQGELQRLRESVEGLTKNRDAWRKSVEAAPAHVGFSFENSSTIETFRAACRDARGRFRADPRNADRSSQRHTCTLPGGRLRAEHTWRTRSDDANAVQRVSVHLWSLDDDGRAQSPEIGYWSRRGDGTRSP